MKITKETKKEELLKHGQRCNKCGHCCSFDGCFVLEHEIGGIAKHLHMDKAAFKEKYLDEHMMFNKVLFKTKRLDIDKPYGPCIFLDGSICMIHTKKPLHCRIGSCDEHGPDVMEWFFLNYLVDPNDPQSIREWHARTRGKKTIPGGMPHELVPDKKTLHKILDYEIMHNEKDWEKELGIDNFEDKKAA